jgi:hypothetical protein
MSKNRDTDATAGLRNLEISRVLGALWLAGRSRNFMVNRDFPYAIQWNFS